MVTKSSVPCALQRYLSKVDNQTSFAQLSLSQRQLAFQHWAAYNSKAISKAISNKGDFVCPLLPCLEHFKNLESCLRHLLDCPKLSQASYWCPFCRKEENFAALGPCRDGNLNPASREPSTLKRAIACVTRFGRKRTIATRNDQQSVHAESRRPLPPEISNKRQTQLPELSCQAQQLPELPSEAPLFELSNRRESELSNTRRAKEQLPVEPSGNDSPQVGPNQNDVWRSPSSREPSGLKRAIAVIGCFGRKSSIATRNDSNKPQLFEHSDNRQTRPFKFLDNRQAQLLDLSDRHRTKEKLSVDSSASTPEVGLSRNDILKSSASRLKRAITFVKRFARKSSISPRNDNNIGLPQNVPQRFELPDNSQTQLFDLSDRHRTREHSSAESSANDAAQVKSIEVSNPDKSAISPFSPINSLERMFELLRESVNNLYQSWTNQLILHSRFGADVRFFLYTPFETGIQILHEFNRGSPPKTFEDIFALMHIAHACAGIYHKKDERHFWYNFFLDILPWHLAIATKEDTELFFEAASLLWSDRDFSEAETNEKFDDTLSQFRWTPQASDLSMEPSFESQVSLGILDPNTLHNILREGQVICCCTRYVDDFGAPSAVDTTQTLESPISKWSSQSTSMDSPTTIETSSTFLGSPDSSDNNSNTTLAPHSTPSSSPVEVSSPTSNNSLYCPICEYSFHSKKDQDKRSNLNRHMLNMHTSRTVLCSEPGCDKRFPRSDNMLRHVRNVHRI